MHHRFILIEHQRELIPCADPHLVTRIVSTIPMGRMREPDEVAKVALLGIVIAIAGVLAAVLAIPGIPKMFHLDSDSTAKQPRAASASKTKPPIATPVMKRRDITSGQVNFGCNQFVIAGRDRRLSDNA